MVESDLVRVLGSLVRQQAGGVMHGDSACLRCCALGGLSSKCWSDILSLCLLAVASGFGDVRGSGWEVSRRK